MVRKNAALLSTLMSFRVAHRRSNLSAQSVISLNVGLAGNGSRLRSMLKLAACDANCNELIEVVLNNTHRISSETETVCKHQVIM